MEQNTVVILGGGIGGVVAANELKKRTGKLARIIVIDKNDRHIYSPSFLWLMLGERQAPRIQRPLSSLNRKGIEFIRGEVVKIEPGARLVRTDNAEFHYDHLIVALGAELAPDKVSGLAESGHNLYDLKGVERLRDAVKDFAGGKVAIVISSLPFKCPAAPYEAAFLIDAEFQKKGIRTRTQIDVYTPEPLPLPATGPENGKVVKEMLEARSIGFHPERKLISVDSAKKEMHFDGAAAIAFDLLVFVPPHQGARAVRDSGLGNEAGWIPVEKETLRTKFENVYALGDAAAVTLSSGKPRPKAGVFAHFEAEVVAKNVAAEIRGERPAEKYGGRAFCFLETGFGTAGFADGRFYAEPTPVVKLKKPRMLWRWAKIVLEKYWLWKWF